MVEHAIIGSTASAPSSSSFEQQCRLPPELIATIFKSTSFKDLLSCSLVCREWAQIVFPKIHKSLTLGTHPPHRDYRGRTLPDCQAMFECFESFSPFMLSCVRQLGLWIAAQTTMTLDMVLDILDFFPNVRDLNYYCARFPDLDEELTSQLQPSTDDTTSAVPQPCRRSLSTLRLFCDLRWGYSRSARGEVILSSSSMLFQFLGIFHEIKELNLVLLSLGRSPDTPDPKLARQLPRIRSLIVHDSKRDTGTFACLLCQSLDPAVSISVEDKSAMFGFLTRGSDFRYSHITHISGLYTDFARSSFQLPAEQFPNLVALSLRIGLGITHQHRPAEHNQSADLAKDPIRVCVHGLRSIAPSLRDVVFTVDSGYNFLTPSKFLLGDILPQLKELDWDSLNTLFDTTQTIWQTRKIIFDMGRKLSVYDDSGGDDRKRTIVTCEQFGEALRKEIPILRSPNVVTTVVNMRQQGDVVRFFPFMSTLA